MNFAPIPARARSVTKNQQSAGYPMSVTRLLGALLLAVVCSVITLADDPAGDADWAIFVSQRNGATELYLINLSTRQVSQLTNTGRGHITPAVSSQAKVAAFAAREGSSYELFTAQISPAWRTRRPQFAAINRLTIDTIDETNPTLSADGRLIAFASGQGIELMSATGQDRRVLVPLVAGQFDFAPALSPDGRQVAFISNRSGASEIWLAGTSTGEVRQLTQQGAASGGLGWSGDSQQIVFTTTATPSKLSGIAVASAANGTFRVLTEGDDSEPAISPNGSRIIFTSLRDGDPELYLLDLRSGRVERLTNNPGLDGGAVFFSTSVSPIDPNSPGRRIPPSRTLLLERTRRNSHGYQEQKGSH